MKLLNKKIFGAIALFFIAGIFLFPLSAASKTKKLNETAKVEVAQEDSSDSEKADEKSDEKSESKNNKKAKKDKKNKKDKKTKTNKKEKKEIFRTRTLESVVGTVKYLLKGKVGSFQFYAMGKNGSQIPLLAGYDEFTSSFVSLKVGNREYRLTNNIGIIIGTKKIENGVQMLYIVPDVARVLLSFENVNVNRNLIDSEIIKATFTITNKGKRTDTFAFKEVFDTVLGEHSGPHFITSDEISINNERQYRRFDSLQWISSSNLKAGIQFLICGEGITTPEVVTLSNKDLLAMQKWVPQVIASRTFDSVLSYDNSAVCINWPEKWLSPEENYEISFYIAVSSNGLPLDGERFLDLLTKNKDKLKTLNGNFETLEDVHTESEIYTKASELYAASKYREAYKVVCDGWKSPENQTLRIFNLKKMIEEKLGLKSENVYVKPDVLEEKKEVPSETENAQNESAQNEKTLETKQEENAGSAGNLLNIPGLPPRPEKYNKGYIQALIDKIQELTDDGEGVNAETLQQLNEELDRAIKNLES